MILYPAIDLKDGQCVRLELGEMDRATVFNDDPAAQAKAFEAQGFDWLHLVDLNGAFEGHSVNAAPIKDIVSSIDIPIQLGGGIRSMKQIEQWLELGITRVILGTVAVKDPELVKNSAQAFPGKIAVGIDARDGYVAVEGWAETSELRAEDLAKRFEDAGVAVVIYTDISRDGVLKGINVPGTVKLAKATTIPIIASGGLAGIEDLHALAQANCTGINGVISGRALYDGRLDPAAALAFLKGQKHA